MGEKTIANELNYPTTSYNSTSLPPGCQFYPSDEQLFSHYLIPKNSPHPTVGVIHVIQEMNVYNFDPSNLPEAACFRFGRGGRKRHWYCYVAAVAAARVLEKGGRKRRACSGYWKLRGRCRDVVRGGAGRVVVGTRKTFVFYSGDKSRDDATRNRWIMYEYSLVDHPKATFVLCRVFQKPHQGNNLSEHVLSSCAEESVGTVRHIGVQCDGTVALPIAEAKSRDDNPADCDNEVLKFPMRLINELDDDITCLPTPEQMGPNQQVTIDATAIDLTAEQLVAIAEEDFIELDDLVCPLPGID